MEEYIPTGTFAKIILSVGVLGTFGAYAIHQKTDVEEHIPVAIITPKPTVTPQPTATAAGTAPRGTDKPTAAPTIVPTATPRGKYRDGTYTGPVADAFYGPLQVRVLISRGRISDVQFLQYPSDRQTSVEINSQAMPYLKQEAIAAQSAQVDGVSGATQTSRAFRETLGAALNQAI